MRPLALRFMLYCLPHMEQTLDNIRNFCIIAHVDHGKTTLSDRILELTKAVPLRELKDTLIEQGQPPNEAGIALGLKTEEAKAMIRESAAKLDGIVPGMRMFIREPRMRCLPLISLGVVKF